MGDRPRYAGTVPGAAALGTVPERGLAPLEPLRPSVGTGPAAGEQSPRRTSINRMRHRVVLFDLDGTLIDSGAMMLASLRHATRTVLGMEIADADLRARVGGSGIREQMRAFGGDRADELVRVYRAHNEPLHAALEACDGVMVVLDTLVGEGRRLGIVTAKGAATIRLAFDVLPELERYFDVVVSADDTTLHKPHPEPVLAALERLDAEPEHAAYVGDSPYDVRAAKAAGVHSVAVLWGGIHGRDHLEAEAPDALVETPEELLAHL